MGRIPRTDTPTPLALMSVALFALSPAMGTNENPAPWLVALTIPVAPALIGLWAFFLYPLLKAAFGTGG